MRDTLEIDDPRLYPDDPSIVSIQIEGSVSEVALCVNPWEARQMAIELRKVANMLLREVSGRMH